MKHHIPSWLPAIIALAALAWPPSPQPCFSADPHSLISPSPFLRVPRSPVSPSPTPT